MIQYLKDKWYLILAAVILVAVFIVVQYIMKKRKIKREQYEQRLKDQVLSEALKNSRTSKNVFVTGTQAAPLDIENVPGRTEGARGGKIVVQLAVSGEKTELYVVKPEEHVLLGSAPGMNKIVLPATNVAQQQCDVFLHHEYVYVKNLNLNFPMALRRKKQQAPVGEKGIRIVTGDVMLIGPYQVQVTLMDYEGNIV